MRGEHRFVRFAWMMCAVCALVLAIPGLPLASVAATAHWQQEDDPAAINLHATGNKAYESQDYELAIDQWNQLLEQYPDYSLRHDVKYYLGQAWFNRKDYAQAATEFRELRDSIQDIAGFRNGPALLVFLGYSRYSQARATDDKAAAATLLKEAIASYATFFEHFAGDDIADQAWFFQGEALAALHQIEETPELLERASASYRKVAEDFPESELVPKALSELGGCLDQAGKFDEAIAHYSAFIERFPNDALVPAVSLRAAEAVRKRATEQQAAGQSDAANRSFEDAIARYRAVLEMENLEQRDLALFHLAWCELQLGKFKEAADAYARLVEDFPESKYIGTAALAAGKYYFSANDMKSAAEWLERVASRPEDPGRAEAIHWLCRIHIQAGDHEKALELAMSASANGGGGEFRPNLLMDAADALHELPGRRAESIPIYQSVAQDFADSPLAAEALYYAAYASRAIGKNEDAIRLAGEFQTRYPESRLMPAALQVLGEAALMSDQAELAESTFRELLEKFPDDKGAPNWQTRLGWALHNGEKFQDAIRHLNAALDGLTEPADRSEAFYVIGSSQLRLDNDAEAAEALEQALSANPARPDANNIRLLAARAHHELGEGEKAAALAREVLENSPDAEIASSARYLLAEFEYGAENWDAAIDSYTKVIDNAANNAASNGDSSDAVAEALYGRGWARFKNGDAEGAIADFDRLLSEFGDRPDSHLALIGRAVARRQAGRHEEAIADLDAFLENEVSEANHWQALYERGMARVGLEQWDQAIRDFEALASNLDLKNPLAANVLYELAWAWKKKGDAAKTSEVFTRLATELPDSRFAAEAHFHIGEALYDNDEFDKAAERYRQCLESDPEPNVGERAAYKIAWCHFEQEDWEEAHRLFQEQVERYPDGALHAIGLSMVAESLFQNENHQEAITAYKVAIPAIRDAAVSDESVRILAPLHAAQSANRTGDHEAARTFAQSVVDDFPDSPYRYAALYELGAALKGLGQADKAIETWLPVAENSLDRTGARARAMIAEQYFQNRDYERAIKEFKLVVYGYPSDDPAAGIDPWRAFSAYEIARCHYVQINDAEAERRTELIRGAREWFQYLLDHFPNDTLAGDTKKQLELLDELQ
jgi:tetratricopeptide (TPR) repeat protein